MVCNKNKMPTNSLGQAKDTDSSFVKDKREKERETMLYGTSIGLDQPGSTAPEAIAVEWQK